jgi:hypothetical protein
VAPASSTHRRGTARRSKQDGAIRRHGDRAVPLLVYDDVIHRWNAGGSLDEGSRLVRDPVIRKAVFRFRFRCCDGSIREVR